MSRLRHATRDTFRSLRNRNYRLYFWGQTVSVSGTWMQGIAQAWLVLQLTGSGTVLGLTTALQFLPILLGGPLAGVIADRVDKRRLLLVTQSTAALLAVALGLLTATGVVTLWMVLALAFAFGCVVAVDNPTRQSFVLEMVEPADVANAVTLNTVVINAARVIGPAVGGLLIAGVGIAVCFLLNGLSYLAVLAALVAMRPAELTRQRPASRGRGQLREGLRYVWATPDLRVPLLVMAVVGMLAYEFHVVLPLLAREVFGGGARTYGIMSSMMGVGAVVGGLATARRSAPTPRTLVRATVVFGGVVLALAAAPTLGVALAVLLVTGAASIVFIATANATLQLRAAPAMRGRVMALWGVAFLGTTPIGGPLVGWVGESYGPRWGLVLGGVAALLSAAFAARSLRGSAATAVAAGDVAVATAVAAAAASPPAPAPAATPLDASATGPRAAALLRHPLRPGLDVVRRPRARRGLWGDAPPRRHAATPAQRRRTRRRARR